MSIKKKSIAIIGLGLMGGSLASQLRHLYPEMDIYGVTRSEKTLKKARRMHVLTEGFHSVRDLYQRVCPDVIVIATPVETIKTILCDIAEYAGNTPIVTDLGSTKKEICALAEKKFRKKMSFVGSHPMTGSHNAGYDYSDKDLYTHAICFVSATRRTPPKALKAITSLWKALQARVVLIDPSKHDKIVARISHLPHAVAFALVATVARYGDEGFLYAGGGFKDFTRIAGSDPTMWQDIFQTNQKNILTELRAFRRSIDRLIAIVEEGERQKLFTYFENVSDYRRTIQGSK
jgi:prephenate dehydrogenase